MAFVETNVVGTVNLLNAARDLWGENVAGKRFYHISTDEVFGALGAEGFLHGGNRVQSQQSLFGLEGFQRPLCARLHETYGLPVVISNCSNNYGPNHFPEKLIPLMIHNILEGKPLPVYGDGKYTRDWLYVEDHAAAIETVFLKGQNGETYCIGGWNEWQNIDLVRLLCDLMDARLEKPAGTSQSLITFVKDRPGHDLRYAIDATKIHRELGLETRGNV